MSWPLIPYNFAVLLVFLLPLSFCRCLSHSSDEEGASLVLQSASPVRAAREVAKVNSSLPFPRVYSAYSAIPAFPSSLHLYFPPYHSLFLSRYTHRRRRIFLCTILDYIAGFKSVSIEDLGAWLLVQLVPSSPRNYPRVLETRRASERRPDLVTLAG